MTPVFTAHNIRFEDGSQTMAGSDATMDQHPWFLAAKRLLETLFPEDRSHISLVDLGCLEGGYTVEFARLGLQATGIEIRDSNIAACRYVAKRANLSNLTFVKDDVLNVAKHGPFDVTFCCGLLYHLDNPRSYLKILGEQTRKVLILQTHFSTVEDMREVRPPGLITLLKRALGRPPRAFDLSDLAENEGVKGRWYREFHTDEEFAQRDAIRWASWDNKRSFWPLREELLQLIDEAGFGTVLEQFDHLAPAISHNLRSEDYRAYLRGTFIGLKS